MARLTFIDTGILRLMATSTALLIMLSTRAIPSSTMIVSASASQLSTSSSLHVTPYHILMLQRRVSGYENQLSPQVAILQELTAQIKSTSCLTDITAKKVVYVGHSFGSSISLGALGQDESLADGLILTGAWLNSL